MERLYPIQKRISAWRTSGRRTMGIRKVYARLCQPIQIGRFRLRVAAEKPRPVVHVIDRNEQDVGFPCRS